MPTKASEAGDSAVTQPAPTEPPTGHAAASAPKPFKEGQTVCNECNERGKSCNGHLKQISPRHVGATQHLRGDDALHQCQTCGMLYVGPPLGFLRDPAKQRRFVMREQNLILQAAGGTLPAFRRNEAGALVNANEPLRPAPAATELMPGAPKAETKAKDDERPTVIEQQ